MDHSSEKIRLDIWLWRARFVKTRSLSSAFVEKGKVRIYRAGLTRRVKKPSTFISIGDEIIFARGGRLTHVRVEAIGTRRGPASEAALLYHNMVSESAGDAIPD